MCYYTQQGKTAAELTDYYNRDIGDFSKNSKKVFA